MMRKKQGITVTMMAVTVTILLIIAVTITYSISSTMNFSRLSNWVNEISYVQDVVDEKITNTSTFVSGLDSITVDVSGLTTEQIAEQFDGETLTGNTIKLYVLDLGTLNITNTVYGNLDSSQDVYAVSSATGRVYYAGGLEVDNVIYYALTDNLKERFNITATTQNLSTVVFVPSTVGYSNSPITVTVKVPSTFSSIEVTTSNSEITVGSQEVKDKTYEYEVNTNNVAGNYTVNVTYNNGVDTVTTKYTVNGYDVTKPVISQISSANFVYKQTDTDTIDYLINITATDESGIKYLKYSVGTISETEAYEYFENNGNLIVDGKINLYRDTTDYTIYAEDKAGNYSVVNIDISEAKNVVLVSEKWQENVTVIVDGVPIPKGFVASPYGADEENGIAAENTKAGGLVIYQLTDTEITNGATTLPSTETQYTSWTTRNQYVWVPMDNFEEEFVRKDFLNATSKVVDENGSYNALGSSGVFWEVIVDEETNLPLTTLAEQGETYMSAATLAEVQAMYASVKEYGGFYIARYEAGIDTQRISASDTVVDGSSVHSKMNKIPYNYIGWSESLTMNIDTGKAVEVARSIYPESNANYGVVSTLAYGVQWDRTIQWFIDTGAMLEDEVNETTGSTEKGNYYDHDIASYTELNEGAEFSEDSGASYSEVTESYAKGSDTTNEKHILTTGALKAAKVNNIYDMAGNMYEWTMEGRSSYYRIFRGGDYHFTGSSKPVAYRDTSGYYQHNCDWSTGFRVALYIKQEL